jgi:hypothetical protein
VLFRVPIESPMRARPVTNWREVRRMTPHFGRTRAESAGGSHFSRQPMTDTIPLPDFHLELFAHSRLPTTRDSSMWKVRYLQTINLPTQASVLEPIVAYVSLEQPPTPGSLRPHGSPNHRLSPSHLHTPNPREHSSCPSFPLSRLCPVQS